MTPNKDSRVLELDTDFVLFVIETSTSLCGSQALKEPCELGVGKYRPDSESHILR